MNKKQSRIRRARRARAKIAQLGVHRLCVYRTPRHIYAQVIAPNSSETLASASTVSPALRAELQSGGNIDAAVKVGKAIGEAALAAGITEVAFDRGGFRYHGRVKALADAARESGLKF